ncbi:MAG: hypothetical protein V4541_11805 [Bacteroidota bacterium]
MKTIRLISALAVILLLWSCSPATRITGSWVDPSAKGKMVNGKTLFIASLTRNMEVRTKLENAIAEQATSHNLKTIKSTTQFSPDFYQDLPPEKELLAKIRNTGADVILTISLINKESETRYVRGTQHYSPFTSYRWYGGFYSYFNYWRPMLYEPGYYVTDKTYFMETNLYDMESNRLIWSAQSETVNPGSIDNFVSNYPAILIDQLVKDGLLSM